MFVDYAVSACDRLRFLGFARNDNLWARNDAPAGGVVGVLDQGGFWYAAVDLDAVAATVGDDYEALR